VRIHRQKPKALGLKFGCRFTRHLFHQSSPASGSAAIFETGSKATTTPVAPAVPRVFSFSMQAEQSIVVDPKSPGGINSPHGLILFDGVCVLCSRGCGFVSKRDRRGYFRFVPMQLAEGRPLAEQLGINPDRPDSFAFVANGQAYVKSEAVLRIARELPRWQWTWLFHFIPRVIRDAIYDLVARNRYRWFGRRDTCILPNSDRSW
jgi:predicted DCC family thiol-disulfide oxidoreductase YuxK